VAGNSHAWFDLDFVVEGRVLSLLEVQYLSRLPQAPEIMQNVLPALDKSEETKDIGPQSLTLDNIETALAGDTKVKLAGIDVDGESD